MVLTIAEGILLALFALAVAGFCLRLVAFFFSGHPQTARNGHEAKPKPKLWKDLTNRCADCGYEKGQHDYELRHLSPDDAICYKFKPVLDNSRCAVCGASKWWHDHPDVQPMCFGSGPLYGTLPNKYDRIETCGSFTLMQPLAAKPVDEPCPTPNGTEGWV